MKSALRLELFLLFAFVLLTNRWMDWQEGIRYVQADDSRSYELIAEAAPGLPDPNSPKGTPLYHHAQRILPHYVVGTAAKWTGVNLGLVYHAAAILVALAVAYVAQLLLLRIGLADDIPRRALLAAFIFNPYTFRYYWIAPTMFADLVFVLGLGIALVGLAGASAAALLAGVALAALGRQTLLLGLPGIALWIACTPAWKVQPLAKRALVFAAASALVVGIYAAGAALVEPFTGPMVHGPDIFAGFAKWLVSEEFSVRLLAEHLLRVFMPAITLLALSAAFWIAAGKRRLAEIPFEFWAGWTICAGMVAQPLVVDPIDVGRNQSRQAAIAMIAALAATAYLFRDARWSSLGAGAPRAWIACAAALALASFHHLYTLVGPPSVGIFAALHLFAAAAAGVSFCFYAMQLNEKYGRSGT